jgi:hypothetical protein
MDFVLLRSITRNQIVASARVTRHRQIPVIQPFGPRPTNRAVNIRCIADVTMPGGQMPGTR